MGRRRPRRSRSGSAVRRSPPSTAARSNAARKRLRHWPHALGLELRTLEDVKETDCGDWTGQALDELRKQETWTQVQVFPSGFRFPNGESMLEIQTRMVAALDALQKQHAEQTIAVFSHSDPIKLAVAFYMGMPLDLFQRLEISPASIRSSTSARCGCGSSRMNDAAHVPPASETPAATPR